MWLEYLVLRHAKKVFRWAYALRSLLSKCMESQTRNILLIPVRNTLFLTSLSIWQKTRLSITLY